MRKLVYEEISKAVREQTPEGYPMSLVGDDAITIEKAVNVCIDAHLEACFIRDRGDSYAWASDKYAGKRLSCLVSAESMPVLLRRLLEMDDDENEDLSMCAGLLVVDILGTLDINVSLGEFEIISSVDVAT